MTLPSIEKDMPMQAEAAIKIQAAFRRHRAYRLRSICESLKRTPLLSSAAATKLSLLILAGDLSCSPFKASYFFVPHTFDSEIGDRIWVRLDPQLHCTRIQRIGFQELGRGSFKQVYASSTLFIPWDSNEPGREEPSVAFRVACRYHCEQSKRGVDAVRSILGSIVADPKFHLSGCWNGFDVEKVKYTQEELAFWSEGPRLIPLKRGSPAPQLLSIFRDAATVLIQMHQHHILHGDISWDNLMVDQKGQGWIIDLDWCGPIRKWPRDDRARRDVLWAKEGLLTPMSDIYGLAYQLAVGIFGKKFEAAIARYGGHNGSGISDPAFLDEALPFGEDEGRNQLALAIRELFQDCQRLYEELDPKLLCQLGDEVWAEEYKWQQFDQVLRGYPGIANFLSTLSQNQKCLGA